MKEYIVDLHLHSKYSRAVSKDMNLEEMSFWGEKKGIDILSCADFTHPTWFTELKSKLKQQKNGLYKLKNSINITHFILSTELSCIYSQDGQVRRIHLVVTMPNLNAVAKFNKLLIDNGGKLKSDGRPILGMSAEKITELAKIANKNSMVFPAHIWTPWFAMFGSKSGFDNAKQCFGKQYKHIHAIETGLSSDPAMNWQISQLDHMQIISSSDAHSARKIGREATVLKLKELTYNNIQQAIENPTQKNKISYTIELYPEEGMYYYDGHRNCKLRLSPTETKKYNSVCPKCKKKITVGVMNRVDKLADKPFNINPTDPPAKQAEAYEALRAGRPPFKSIIPLQEIIANAFGVGPTSKRVQTEYENIIRNIGPEFEILLHTSREKLEQATDKLIAEGIMRVRKGKLHILPGYDGEFGTVNVFTNKERDKAKKDRQIK
ncbi:MAG: endonuclease Q family protein [Candidatus Kerfeldbacteria bacterium]